MTLVSDFAGTAIADWWFDVMLQGTLVFIVAILMRRSLRQPVQRLLVGWCAALGLVVVAVVCVVPSWPRVFIGSTSSLIDRDRIETSVAVRDRLTESYVVENTPVPAEIAPNELAVAADSSDGVTAAREAVDVNPPNSWRERSAEWIRVVAQQRHSIVSWIYPWMIASFALAVIWLGIGAWRLRHVLRRSQEAPTWMLHELDGIVGRRRRPALRVTAAIEVPSAVGLFSPTILWPESRTSETDRAAIRAGLLHEMAHIERLDLWLLAIERLLLLVFCLHPLFWMFRKRLRVDQECLADATALADCDPVEYAEALLGWAQVRSPGSRLSAVAGLSVWEEPNSLLRRVEMVLSSEKAAETRTTRRARLVIGGTIAVALLAITMVSSRITTVGNEREETKVLDTAEIPIASQSFTEVQDRNSESKSDVDDAAKKVVLLECLVARVENSKLAEAETSIGEIIQNATSGECRLEKNVICANLSPESLAECVKELGQHSAITVYSRPTMVTADGVAGRVHIGKEVILAVIEEVVNGENKSRVMTQNAGIELTLVPQISKAAGSTEVSLDVRMQVSDDEGNTNRPNDPRRFVSRSIAVNGKVTSGGVFLAVEKPSKHGARVPESHLVAVFVKSDVAGELNNKSPQSETAVQKALSFLQEGRTPEPREKTDTAPQGHQVALLTIELKLAEETLKIASLELANGERLVSSNVISSIELARLKSTMEKARLEVERAHIKLEMARDTIKSGRL